MYVLAAIRAGCLEEIHVFFDNKKAAKNKRDSLLEDYGLTKKDKPDNSHCPDCRWNDENEVHLHTLRALGFGEWSED